AGLRLSAVRRQRAEGPPVRTLPDPRLGVDQQPVAVDPRRHVRLPRLPAGGHGGTDRVQQAGQAHGFRPGDPGASGLAQPADAVAADQGALPAGWPVALPSVPRQRADLQDARQAVLRHVTARAADPLAQVARMSVGKAAHWAGQRERGSYWLMKFPAGAVRWLGRRALAPLLSAIVRYFFVCGRQARRSIRQYQHNLASWSGRAELAPHTGSVFAQFMAFADALLDKLDVWNGKLGLEQITLVDPHGLRQQLHREPRGQMLVGAHLGNLEVCRALAELGEKVQMNVLVHTKHAEQFNRLLCESGASHLRLIQVSELDAAIMLQLSERLERGE